MRKSGRAGGRHLVVHYPLEQGLKQLDIIRAIPVAHMLVVHYPLEQGLKHNFVHLIADGVSVS